MPALKKVAPVILKEILEAAEWAIYSEDRWNWSLVNSEGLSVEIPKRGRLVSFQVMENALAQADLRPGDYFRLLGIVEEARQIRGLPPDGTEAHPRIH
jgi:hypothetical protein